MKKTLFAMAALALCGTAVAEPYYASEYVGDFFDQDVFGTDASVVFNVDTRMPLFFFSVNGASALTLNFVGANVLLAEESVDLEVGLGSGSLAITGDTDAQNHWVTALTSADITSVVPLAICGDFFAPPAATSFYEWDEATQGITLGNATVDYMGYHAVASEDAAKAVITGDNQIALVAIGNDGNPGSLVLVGKITPTAPEPATATLSLLALAGLASRRRRK